MTTPDTLDLRAKIEAEIGRVREFKRTSSPYADWTTRPAAPWAGYDARILALEWVLDALPPPADDALAPGGMREAFWLVETPATDNSPARWWHPQRGWCIDWNKALRFARKEDADDYAKSKDLRGALPRFASEHSIILPEPPEWPDLRDPRNIRGALYQAQDALIVAAARDVIRDARAGKPIEDALSSAPEPAPQAPVTGTDGQWWPPESAPPPSPTDGYTAWLVEHRGLGFFSNRYGVVEWVRDANLANHFNAKDRAQAFLEDMQSGIGFNPRLHFVAEHLWCGAPQAPVQEGWRALIEPLGYTATFNAIAAAVKREGDAISVSVEKFLAALPKAAPPPPEGDRREAATDYYRHLTDRELADSLRAEAAHGITSDYLQRDKFLLAAERLDALTLPATALDREQIARIILGHEEWDGSEHEPPAYRDGYRKRALTKADAILAGREAAPVDPGKGEGA